MELKWELEMIEVMEDREVWQLNLELLPQQPSRKSGQWRKKKELETLFMLVNTMLYEYGDGPECFFWYYVWENG